MAFAGNGERRDATEIVRSIIEGLLPNRVAWDQGGK
jgi:hypothetical protein